MKFRRNKSDQAAAETDAGRAADESDVEASSVGAASEAGPDAGSADRGYRTEGPWDITETTIDEDDAGKVDLGGLIVTGRPGLELRLQVSEAGEQIVAVLLVGPRGAVELRPFAAPRNSDIWDDIRKQIAAETARRGGTATEEDGAYGKELHVVMPVTTPEGQSATQPSRVLGISGPRWLLRATFLGRPAMEPDQNGDLESALRDVVVVRGNEPMAPGDPLPLVMPSNAQPMQPPS
ncbi:MAG: DUF3710 domain-containing protein [Nocardioidaceae bacterium]